MKTGKVDVLLGLQWGDEGKGKVVDVLTPRYDAVARFQGGPNAGHTLEFNGEKYVLRSIPSTSRFQKQDRRQQYGRQQQEKSGTPKADSSRGRSCQDAQ